MGFSNKKTGKELEIVLSGLKIENDMILEFILKTLLETNRK